MSDPVEHPSHYTSDQSGVECIEITEHMMFCPGNSVKYLWREGKKIDAVEDRKKALWYARRELDRKNRSKFYLHNDLIDAFSRWSSKTPDSPKKRAIEALVGGSKSEIMYALSIIEEMLAEVEQK